MGEYCEYPETIVQSLESNTVEGLSSSQVKERTEKYGPNKLQEKKKKTWMQRFFEQFKDAMIVILIIASIISFVIACIEKNPNEFFEPALILLIVVLNAIMGVMQESKAEKAIEALQEIAAATSKVIRDGHQTTVRSE